MESSVSDDGKGISSWGGHSDMILTSGFSWWGFDFWELRRLRGAGGVAIYFRAGKLRKKSVDSNWLRRERTKSFVLSCDFYQTDNEINQSVYSSKTTHKRTEKSNPSHICAPLEMFQTCHPFDKKKDKQTSSYFLEKSRKIVTDYLADKRHGPKHRKKIKT